MIYSIGSMPGSLRTSAGMWRGQSESSSSSISASKQKSSKDASRGTTSAARKVAIVEDVSELSKIYSMVLRLEGHEVAFTARSGEEAVEAAKKGELESVDSLIIDYRMPGIDGLKAAEGIVRFTPK